MANQEFIRTYPPAVPPIGKPISFVFEAGKLIVSRRDGGTSLPDSEELRAAGRADGAPAYFGDLDGRPVLAQEREPGARLPEPLTLLGLRELYGVLSDEHYSIAGYASQILYWLNTSRYCPVCGHTTESREGDWGRACPDCGHVGYPRVSPATLILIHDNGRILLGHKKDWGDRYSILAGFVEPGESLEECVRREAFEEAGVEIDNLAYFGSQPWPYPHQLMVGFTARLASGEIRVDGVELDDARWFAADSLPTLPPPLSLSRQMIDTWARRQGRPATGGG